MRLRRRPGGGFLLEGDTSPLEGVPESGALVIRDGRRTWRMKPDASGRSVTGRRDDGGGGDDEAFLITWSVDDDSGAASVLLADGRLYRWTVHGLAAPSISVDRWDGPGPYLTARPDGDAWELTPTPAGRMHDALEEIVIATCFEIGRRDAWWETS